MNCYFAKLCHCKSAIECYRNYHNHLYLIKNFKTFSSIPKNPIEIYDGAGYNHSTRLNQLSYVLDRCAKVGDLFTAFLVHVHLIKLEFNGLISLWNKLLNIYSKWGHIQLARRLFDVLGHRNVVSFNTMISAYVRNKHDPFEVMHIYSMMKEGDVIPNYITLAALISACDALADLVKLEVLHAQAVRYGLNFNEFVGSSLIDGYAKQRRLEAAIKAFDEITELDLVSWNIMIDSCVRRDSKKQALKIFSRMLLENVGFDSFTLTGILKTCSEPEDMNLGRQIHGYAITSSLAYETPIGNSLITMYSKCELRMSSATKVFRRISEPNIISWTAIIAGFMQNGHNEEAVGLYKEMLRFGEKENNFSFASIIPVSSNLSNIDHGMQIHARIVKSWFGYDVSVNNALLDMYSKCGNLQEAQLVFNTMVKHNVVSCTSMITGFAQHGKVREALNILEQMTSEGLVPDEVTFLGCLSACSHGGLVDEGIKIFKIMIDVHNLKPRREHFASVVDMLGRAGRLNEAENFIEEMGVQSDVSVWEALLGACRLHGDVGLGKKAARKMMELQPDRHGAYVTLANMYADKGFWEDKEVIREKLVENRLRKEAGCSWVS